MQCGLSPRYVMDEMEMYEIGIYMDNLHIRNREQWEQTRFISYVVANNNPFRKKELPLKNILKFSWDDDGNDGNGETMSEEEIKNLSEKAKAFEKYVVSSNG